MSTHIDERVIEEFIKKLGAPNPKLTKENIIKRFRTQLESKGIEWNDDIEKRIKMHLSSPLL
jgi:hypothetical protein